MKVTRDKHALVLTDFPYLIALVAFPAAAFMVYQAVKAYRDGNRTRDLVGASIAATLFFLGGVLFTQRSRFEFDLPARELRWSRRSLLRRTGGVVPFDQIQHAIVQVSHAGHQDQTHRVVLLLADDTQLPLTRAFDANPLPAERARIAINEVLR